jgi:dihydrofolate reductase
VKGQRADLSELVDKVPEELLPAFRSVLKKSLDGIFAARVLEVLLNKPGVASGAGPHFVPERIQLRLQKLPRNIKKRQDLTTSIPLESVHAEGIRMRKVIFGGANSLDNYIARPDGSYDWIMFGEEAMELMKGMWSRFDTMIMGRKTYEVATGGASKRKKKKPAKNPYGNIRTFVFSRTSAPGVRDGVEFLSEDPGKFVRGLKKQKGKDIMVMGGGDLARSLFEAGVIDEIGFNIHPVLLGEGIPLFYKMKRQIDLELIEARPFKNGCVYVLYKVKKGRPTAARA